MNKFDNDQDLWIGLESEYPKFDLPLLVCTTEDVDSITIARLTAVRVRHSAQGKHIRYDFLEGQSSSDCIHFDPTHWRYLPSCKNKISS